MLNVVMLNVIMLNVFMLNIDMLSVVADLARVMKAPVATLSLFFFLPKVKLVSCHNGTIGSLKICCDFYPATFDLIPLPLTHKNNILKLLSAYY